MMMEEKRNKMGFAPQALAASTNPEPKSCDHRGMYAFRDLDAMSYRYCEGCGTTCVLVQDAHDGKFMLVEVPEFGVEKWDEVEVVGEGEDDQDQVSDEEVKALGLGPEHDREQEHLSEFEHERKPDGRAESELEQALPGVPAEPAEQPVPPRPKRQRRKASGLSGLQAPPKRRGDAEVAS